MNGNLSLKIKCEDCPINHRAVCSHCNAEEMKILEGIKFYRRYKSGEQILWRGDPLQYVASVVEGVATLSKSLEDGRTQMVGLLLQGDFIGRMGRRTVDFDIIAASDMTLCCFDKTKFERLVIEIPHISERLIEISFDELDAARDWMLLLGRKTASEKIATFLQMIVNRHKGKAKPGQPMQLSLPLSRREIADYLGLTLETVSRQLSKLKSKNIIVFFDKRRFQIKDIPALQGATGDDGAINASF